jgi:hypothetical protein
MSDKDDAKKLVDDFAVLPSCPSMWVNMDRAKVAAGLKARIDNPDLIKQGKTSLCGPADFIRDIADDKPVVYAQAAIDLYKFGIAKIGTIMIFPGDDLKKYALPASANIDHSDWIVLASLRDTDNWWFDYQSDSDGAAAITMPHSKAKWLTDAGYSDVINETNILKCMDLANAKRASDLFLKGYKVALFVNANILDSPRSPSFVPNHWIALTSPILIKSFNLTHPGALNVDPNSSISLEVYTWGGRQKIPLWGRITDYEFLSNYYGFVAGLASKV